MEDTKENPSVVCKEFVCHVCGVTLRSKYTLQEHIQSLHRNEADEIFACAHCPKVFRVRQRLVRHLSVMHDGSERFHCEYCSKKFSTFTVWKRHLASHSKEKIYKCAVCSKAYKHRTGLSRHMSSIHLNMRSYVCEVCGADFNTKAHLKRHSFLHLDIKPFKCQFCGKECTQPSNLKTHIMGVHKDISHLVYKKDMAPVILPSISIPSYKEYIKDTRGITENKPVVKKKERKSYYKKKIKIKKSVVKEKKIKPIKNIKNKQKKIKKKKKMKQNKLENIDELKDEPSDFGFDDNYGPMWCSPEDPINCDLDNIKQEPLSPKTELDDLDKKEIVIKKEYEEDEHEAQKSVACGEIVMKYPNDDDKNNLVLVKQPDDVIKEDKEESSTVGNEVTENERESKESSAVKKAKKKYKKNVLGKTCAACNKTYKTVGGMYSHLMRMHKTCYKCNKVFTTKKAVLRHFFNKCCGDCDKIQDVNDECDTHKRINKENASKTDNKPDQVCYCHVCGKKMCRYGDLKRHLENRHSTEIYQCDQCSKNFTAEWKLNQHKLIHTGNEPFKCSLCPKKFLLYGSLKRHIKCHSSAKNFMCDICPSKFKLKGDLSRHVNAVHLNIRRYPCKVCGANFIESNQLKRHSLLHTGERPFKCQFCGKQCTQASNLKIHIMGVHKDLSHLVYNKKDQNSLEVDPEAVPSVPKFSKDYLNDTT